MRPRRDRWLTDQNGMEPNTADQMLLLLVRATAQHMRPEDAAALRLGAAIKVLCEVWHYSPAYCGSAAERFPRWRVSVRVPGRSRRRWLGSLVAKDEVDAACQLLGWDFRVHWVGAP